ncbi:MAG: alpha/beta fold hydrolase [Methylococcales bacterium]|nr:alpha/beta fold hydrolase [Methylococcales bacterium]
MKLAYEEYGDINNEPLLIIHGFFASSRNWRNIAKRLADEFNVYLLDMRNHGQSPHHSEMDYSTMSEDINTFMGDHGLIFANIMGHSMGGKVAMWFSLNNPEKVKNLIVADISPVSYQHSFDNTIQALKDIPLDKISIRKQADDYLSTSIPEKAYRLFLLQNLLFIEGEYVWRVDLDIFYNTADNIIAFPPLGLLNPYDNKALFIMGGNSHYTDKEAIFSYFPKAEISVLPKANHWLHIDDPEGFLHNVKVFLKKT